MSDLAFLEDLLDGAEVEWKPLGEVAKQIYSGGTPDTKVTEYWENGTVPWMSSGEVNLKTVYGTVKFISEKGLKNSSARPVPANSVVIALAGQGKTRGKVARTRIELTTNQSLAAIVCDPRKLDADYVYHFLESKYENLRQISSGDSGRGGLNLKLISDYCLPIPCPEVPEKSLAIQGEIVRILDSFTELTAELTAELELRKKQYNHYRDQLLSPPADHVEWKPLGWVGEVRMCKRVMKNQTSSSGEIPFFKIGTFGKRADSFVPRVLFEEFKKKYSYPRVGEVLISASGTLGRAVIFDGEDAYFQDSNIVWLENDESKVLNKYLFYFYQIAKWHVSDGGVIQRLYNDNIKRTELPVPYPNDPERSLAEQARIVAILDKFDTLTTSLNEGLPREIALRQQQYEYYRDLLLSFPKLAEAVEA